MKLIIFASTCPIRLWTKPGVQKQPVLWL